LKPEQTWPNKLNQTKVKQSLKYTHCTCTSELQQNTIDLRDGMNKVLLYNLRSSQTSISLNLKFGKAPGKVFHT